MSSEVVDTNDKSPEGEEEKDMRIEHAGSTPLPQENTDAEEMSQEARNDEQEVRLSENEEPGPLEAPPTTVHNSAHYDPDTTGYPGQGRGDAMNQQQQLPPCINQLAIMASAQNKLPVSKVKGIVLRLGRHTESSVQKTGKWFKNESYVDKDCYTWKNMPLFEDHQCHLWTQAGTVRSSYKK